jgi:hypothetical protein
LAVRIFLPTAAAIACQARSTMRALVADSRRAERSVLAILASVDRRVESLAALDQFLLWEVFEVIVCSTPGCYRVMLCCMRRS